MYANEITIQFKISHTDPLKNITLANLRLSNQIVKTQKALLDRDVKINELQEKLNQKHVEFNELLHLYNKQKLELFELKLERDALKCENSCTDLINFSGETG